MNRLVCRAGWLAVCCAAVASAGCVSRKVHEQTLSDLEKARVANADLVRKYNQDIGRLRDEKVDPAPADTSALLARLRKTEEENRELRKKLQAAPSFSASDARRVGVKLDDQGGFQLGSALLFDEGTNNLKPGARQTLDRMASLIRSEYPGERLVIEGHTDNQELLKTKSRWQYNMRLAWERAYAVFRYLEAHGIPESRMLVRAYSFNKPTDAATQNTKEGRRQNRRVVVRRAGTKI